MVIKTYIKNFELGKKYTLLQETSRDLNNIRYIAADFKFYRVGLPNYIGKLKITRLDIPKNIVSGAFEFKAVDENGNVVNITDGRFDKKLYR